MIKDKFYHIKDPYEVNFAIEGLPQTLNAIGRKHWAVKVKEARHWKHLVLLALGSAIPRVPLQKAKLTLIRHSSREPDFDGLTSTWKHIIDGLTEARVIVDDKPSIIGSPIFLWHKAPQKKGFIEVNVKSLPS